MKEKEIPLSKWEKLKKYLADKEKIEVLLLDLLLNKEIPQEYYRKQLEESEKAYYRFINELKKTPKEDSQQEIPFNQ